MIAVHRGFLNLTLSIAALGAISAGWPGSTSPALGQAPAKQAAGPLRVHPDNPRYFTDGAKQQDGSLRAVYLTGSHPWNNLQDQGITSPPPEFDFSGYLDFLERHGHNFIRLWRFELTEWNRWDATRPPFRYTTHHPWKRTGPGIALDKLPRFDFEKWDEVHFERLRSRVRAARDCGIYVSVMLFEGCLLREQPSTWFGHPMNAANNINGIDGDVDGDGRGLEVQMRKVEAITRLQKAYVRKVIDTINDLDNVLYEISNESLDHPDILKWQTEMVDFINEYQSSKPQQHPVGMTNLVAFSAETKLAANNALLSSPADWVSPGATIFGPEDPYSVDPPATTGKKVLLLDSDHTWNNACMTRTSKLRADHAWVWKSFLRGYHPIYMDPLDLSQSDGVMGYAIANAYAVVLARPAMGHTRAYAERMNLAAMTPRDDLASTKYCLANPGKEYLVYLPDGGEATVDLVAAKAPVAVEWFNPRTSEKRVGDKVDGGAQRLFQAPFEGDAVLYLHRE